MIIIQSSAYHFQFINFPFLNLSLAKQQIISYTMNILSFEIYRCSVIEKEFSAALQEVLGSSENLLRIITVQMI